MNNNYLSHKKPKYLYKEKINGRWRYYYEYDNKRKPGDRVTIHGEYVNAKEHRKRMESAYNVANLRYEADKYNAKQDYNAYKREKNNTFRKLNAKKNLNKQIEKVKNQKKEADDYKKKYDDAKSDYRKTALGKIEKAANKGRTAIEKILKKRKK